MHIVMISRHADNLRLWHLGKTGIQLFQFPFQRLSVEQISRYEQKWDFFRPYDMKNFIKRFPDILLPFLSPGHLRIRGHSQVDIRDMYESQHHFLPFLQTFVLLL